jgi:hypothetical protein
MIGIKSETDTRLNLRLKHNCVKVAILEWHEDTKLQRTENGRRRPEIQQVVRSREQAVSDGLGMVIGQPV